MARRRVYTGAYLQACNHTRTAAGYSKRNYCISHSISNTLWSVYIFFMDYYVVFCTIFFILVASFVLPDLMHKIKTSKEFKMMKKLVNRVSNEVSRAEVACITAADEICSLHCSMHDDTTETMKDMRDLSVCTSGCMRNSRSEPVQEVAIMSYVYTNSFDALKPTSNASSNTS